MFTARPSPAPAQAAWPRSMHSVFWNRTTAEVLPSSHSNGKLDPAILRLGANECRMGAGCACRGDVAKRSASEPRQAHPVSTRRGQNFPKFRAFFQKAPCFLAIIQGFAGTARIVIRDHGASDLGYRHPSWRGEAGTPGPMRPRMRPIGTGCFKSIGVSSWHAFAT
jgi:hypothetical protein